jgi:arylsulfatase A-like enzyme
MPGVALAVIPVSAATGLCAGSVVALVERLVWHRRGVVAAFGLAAPTGIVTVAVAPALFAGAYAQTLPAAHVLPFALPVVAWSLAGLAILAGRRLARDLMGRAIAILACAGALGAIVWLERHVLRGGYPVVHIGATLAVIVLLGIAVRLVHAAEIPGVITAAVVGVTLGTAAAAAAYGLATPEDRAVLAEDGDQSRDVVHLWRALFDLDRDGASALLGGGDCDDLDPARHPGAVDVPGDGIDQDCDGADAIAHPPAARRSTVASLPPVDMSGWRARPDVRAALDGARGRDVVVITVDALRFDVLAPDTPHREDFPHIAKLLDESVWFTHAIAPASGTDVSLSTLLTGRFDPYQPIATTLPEAARALGMRTTAAIPGEVLRFVGETLLTRGFDRVATIHTDWRVQDVGDHVSAAATAAEALRALDAQRPCFVWLHFFDVHEHHQIEVPQALLAAVDPGGSVAMHRYRALLHAIDDALGRVLERVGDRAIIVFASDHGEALGEDPRLLDTHGMVAYAPLVRVPLAIRVPGVAPARRTDPVSLVDLAPTVLDLLGHADAMAPLDGTSLVPALLDAPPALRPPVDRALVIHEELQWSVVEWPYQLLVRPGDNVVELYDLERDPGERDNLTARDPEVVSRLRARYAEVPSVRVDRTPAGRSYREQQARPPPSHGQQAAAAPTSRP